MRRVTAWLFVGTLIVALPCTALVANGKEKKKSLEMLFRLADLNGDGKLSSSEAGEMNANDNKEDRSRRFKKFDRNGDRRLTLEEFKQGDEREKKKR
jgi:Ca2+-binding EF-hand superfamily protein